MKPQVEKPTERLAGCVHFKIPCLGVLLVQETKQKR